MISNTPEQPTSKRPLGRRVALAGVLTAAVLAGGAGVAYATGTVGSAPVESGYGTVVEDVQRSADSSRGDCPEPGAGGGAGGGSSEGPREAPSDAPSQTPEQLPTPEGDI